MSTNPNQLHSPRRQHKTTWLFGLSTVVLTVLLGTGFALAQDGPTDIDSREPTSLELVESPPSDPGCSQSMVTYEDYTKTYSPFAISLDDNPVFSTITFEDVGLDVETEALRGALYEVISEAVAQEIRLNPAMNYTPVVVFDQAMCEPDNHLYCDSHHLYVALWRSSGPDRFGYSLWSGCGASSQFAWNEVEVLYTPIAPLTELVEPLARDIVASLQSAEDASCFQADC